MKETVTKRVLTVNMGGKKLLMFLMSMSFLSCTSQPNSETKTADNTKEVQKEELVSNLNHPWGMAFLPDGRLLVTERSGTLRIFGNDHSLSEPIAGVPEVFNQNQGGLLDVVVDPEFEENNRVYLSFSEPGDGGTASTALGYGTFSEDRLEDFTVIFRQTPKVSGGRHFGSRIVFDEGYVFLTLGERGLKDPAQDLSNHIGTVVRLHKDGSVPDDNPFVGRDGAEDEIWTYGNRNIQAAAIDPETGLFWVGEMGPKGGDELNLIEPGKNYGWPDVSWGENYDGTDIPDPPTMPKYTDAVIHWTPVISPSGMDFYTGDMFTQWKGEMLIGGLTHGELVIVDVSGRDAQEADRVDIGERVRDVAQAPDGSVYIITDLSNGKIWRLYQ